MEHLANNYLLEIFELVLFPLCGLIFGGFYLRLRKRMKEDFVEKWIFERTKQELKDFKESTSEDFKEIKGTLKDIQRDIKQMLNERKK